MEHEFTGQIKQVLASKFGQLADDIYAKSFLLQYLNIKTKSANRGAKARGSFANIYAIYVLVEDYLNNHFDQQLNYSDYEGAKYTDLLNRQRQLPFGAKLQNHGLNSRMNEEFKKYFPQAEYIPILRDVQTNRYWINENLINVTISEQKYNIASTIIEIINLYIEVKRNAFERFIETCEKLKYVSVEDNTIVENFIMGLLAANVDARLFEIVSYSILKFYYINQTIYFGYTLDSIESENLKLYKTGRTNANDGGIDFVMRPLGRFFQVTETLDIKKYFLDIDKIQRYPISFVIKSEDTVDNLIQKLKSGAEKQYSIKAIVQKYMDCIEEIINLVTLRQYFRESIINGYLREILDEIIQQSKVEFNYEEKLNE